MAVESAVNLRVTLSVCINTEFSATHNWPECPIPEVEYLKYPHRHLFKVHVKVLVPHKERAVEFIVFKREVTDLVREQYEGKHLEGMSCEAICLDLLAKLSGRYSGVWFVSVYEDGENGAELEVGS